MALVNCRECGRQISDQAAACPHCGFPMTSAPVTPARPVNPVASPPSPAPKKSGCGTLILIGVVGFLVLALVGTCSAPSRRTTSNSSSVSEQAIKSASAREKAAKPLAPAAQLLAEIKDGRAPLATRIARSEKLIKEHPDSPEAKETQSFLPTLRKLLEEERNPVGKQWDYRRSNDGMSGKTVYAAAVTSLNSFEFDFPYTGSQRATLQIRRHPRWGNDVIFSIEKGQILCSSYSECPVRVRFDDAPAKTYHGNEPADNSNDTVFIPGYDAFVKKLATAKRVRIEVNIYHQGTLQAEFDVSGFYADRLHAK